jgi:hypothetical protein
MPLQLRNDVHWCDSGGRAVFLDIGNDRYFCLPAAVNAAFLKLANGSGRSADPAQLQPLVERGILIEHGQDVGIRSPPLTDAPDRDVLAGTSRSTGPIAISRQLLSELHAARLLKTRPLSAVLERVARNGSTRPWRRDEAALLQDIAASANILSYLWRAHDRCLVRAIAVHGVCKKRGIRSKLIFGVIAHPFAAHCWVQLGGAVVVGGFEQARLYSPILVLE